MTAINAWRIPTPGALERDAAGHCGTDALESLPGPCLGAGKRRQLP